MTTNTSGVGAALAPEKIAELVDRLARWVPGEAPVLSLYLDTRPDQHGRDHYQPFLRKELPARAGTFPAHSPARASVDRDEERIQAWLQSELQRSSHVAAIFACSAAGLFEAVQLEVPLTESRLYVAPHPHLYPLVRVLDQYPRYAALIADTHLSRLFVFGLGRRLEARQVESEKLTRTRVGGWSQMRYQRHVDEHYRHHVKDTIEALARLVRAEGIDHIVLAGDEVVVPLLREELTPELAGKVVDVLALDIRTPEHEVLAETLAALRQHEAESEAAKVEQFLDEYRAGGLAVAGIRDTIAALGRGQAHELLLSADPQALRAEEGAPVDEPPQVADRLVRMARQTDAAVILIEDPELLAPVGGVGATLRYPLERSEEA
jgi:peptide chain release factor subunit 1